ncbi:hypothetical protein [Anaeromyxobacter soli]|uniref:hypothetical protein n=1 Tax=Anaeromyxobacter soli TaxID=2922725 RepID=UPI001FAEA14F|nr:hypothetical protein [Anaeromyxobacter sp. SG29]
MATPLAPGEPLALARALYAEAGAVARFIDENVRTQVEARVPAIPHGVVFQGQLLRAIAWLRSIGKLDHPADFQAVTAGARAIFEGAVDVTLMHFDTAANGPEKMDAWEESAKLKHAQTAAGYIAAVGRQPTEAEQHMLTFISNKKVGIEKQRLTLWPNHKGKHPPRWTGRDLARDAEEAEKVLAEGFEEFYRLRYPELCWNVHGSGLAGIANVAAEAVPYLGGRAASEAAKFAWVVAEVVAKHMGCWDEERFRNLPQQVKEARALAYVAAMHGVGART